MKLQYIVVMSVPTTADPGEPEEKVLEVRRRILGEEHLDTLTTMNNLALTLRKQGDLARARTFFEKALEGQHRILGEEHSDTLRSMNNLAETLRVQGDLAGARTLYKKVLEVLQRVLGEEHPNTTVSAWNLFSTLAQLGERTAAQAVLTEHLVWLLGCDPTTLGADQRKIREMVAQVTRFDG